MSKFKTALTKTLSVDSSSFNHRSFVAASETPSESKSTEKDIFRYSYNLGKQRVAKIHRTASVGGNLLQPMEGSLAKVLLGRRGLPRSMSMESQLGGRTVNETSDKMNSEASLQGSNYPTLNRQLSEKSDGQPQPTVDVTGNNLGEITEPGHEMPHKEISGDSSLSTENGSRSNPVEVKKTSESLAKKAHAFSDSAPDLRSTGSSENERLKREDFTSLFIRDTELPQSRPICKLRRAARRLGVSLSSEEIYHKHRRNGLCTEIDDAAENRKLLRVLNKRF